MSESPRQTTRPRRVTALEERTDNAPWLRDPGQHRLSFYGIVLEKPFRGMNEPALRCIQANAFSDTQLVGVRQARCSQIKKGCLERQRNPVV